MNSLTKMQVLMLAFLLVVLASLLLSDPLIILPAALLFILQVVVSRKSLRREYPEDWVKYSLIFVTYELVLILVFYIMMSATPSLLNLDFLYNLFFVVLLIIVMTLAIKFFVGRRFAHGTTLFSTRGWVGVHLKGDLFSKIKEANYAVENPRGLKTKKGDRVKVAVTGGMGNSMPRELVEVVK